MAFDKLHSQIVGHNQDVGFCVVPVARDAWLVELSVGFVTVSSEGFEWVQLLEQGVGLELVPVPGLVPVLELE